MAFQEAAQLFARLGDHAIMCLATAAEGAVAARSMSVLIHDGKFYFQTDRKLPKCQQINRNPNVALCRNNVSIEGVCRSLGHPLCKENQALMTLYRQRFVASYDRYSALADEVLFEVTPCKAFVWEYENDAPYQELYDFAQETFRREAYPG